jgi:phosphoglycerate kinase
MLKGRGYWSWSISMYPWISIRVPLAMIAESDFHCPLSNTFLRYSIVAEEIEAEAEVKTVPTTQVACNLYIVDIGPQTIELFSGELRKCRTIMWNGPVGVYEIPRFGEGTRSMAKLLSSLASTTIVGGGSTAEIVGEMGLADKMTHVSTGGGASLRFLEGVTLPGVEALLDKEQ